jgi:hypothetical protein
MSIQDKTLSGAEHDWYATRSTATINAPLVDHKISYFVGKGFGGVNKPLTQMEREWLQSVGSSSSIRPFELWSRACEAQSIAVGNSVDECKFNFYTGVASGTNP